MNHATEIVARRPILTLVVVLLITAGAVCGIVNPQTGKLRIEIDSSADRLMPQKDGARRFYDRIRHLFGSDEPMVVALSGEYLFETRNLERIKSLTKEIEALDGVHHVTSLASAVDIRGSETSLDVMPFLDEIPGDPAQRRALQQRAIDHPLYSGTLISEDGRTTALLVYFDRISDREFLERGLDEQITALAEATRGDLELWITGAPHVKAQLSRSLLENLGAIIPVTSVFICLMLCFCFRSVRGALLPLVAMLVALTWTLGTIGWLGQPLNIVTTIIPPLILTLGFAYAMHVVSEFYDVAGESGEDANSKSIVDRALGRVGLPVVITGVTTIAGFMSLLVSPLTAIREFGVFAVLGILYTIIVSLTLTPALLALLPTPKRGLTRARESRLQALASRISDFDFTNRKAIIVVALLVLACMLGGMRNIHVGTDYINSFKASSPVRQDYDHINQELSGANSFYIAFDSSVPAAFAEPENLRELERLQEWLETQPEIGSTTSIADYLKLINQALHADDPAYFATPDSKELAMQLLLVGASDELERMVDARYRKTNLLVRAKVQDSASIADMVSRIEERLEELPAHLEAKTTGSVILLSRTVDDIARGQVQSILIAIATIYLVLSAMFTSLRIGLVALFPNIMPIAIYFGALGIFGITLNPSTSLIACMALGIAVDDTIHYFARFNRDAKRSAREMPATKSALRAVIRPVSYTTLGLCVGFLVMLSSDLNSQAQFGVLAAFTMAAAWLVDITLTPALCTSVRIVTLWDVLQLDLGHAADRSIELFGGLSVRQARIVALMGALEEHREGTVLFREGDPAGDLYVVIDGEMRLCFEREGVRVEWAKRGRGQVVGQSGLSLSCRTSDAEAVSDVRLLRFSRQDLERLRRRYPRIAGQVYMNLNRIQAERITQLMTRVALADPDLPSLEEAEAKDGRDEAC